MKTPKFTLIEIVIAANVTSANSKVMIGNQPQLQSIDGSQTIWVKAIESYSNDIMVKSPLTTSNNVATPAAIKNATLTVVVKGTEELQTIPLARLNVMFGNPATAANHTWDLFQLYNLYQVDWSKSYLQLIEAPAAQPFSYILGVHYAYQGESPYSNE